MSKLTQFIDAALTNPRHPVYRMGMQHSPILQHYALNVRVMEVMKPEQWEKDYPDKAAAVQKVLDLCEAEAAEVAVETTELDALKKRIADLEAKLAAKPETETPAIEPVPAPAE